MPGPSSVVEVPPTSVVVVVVTPGSGNVAMKASELLGVSATPAIMSDAVLMNRTAPPAGLVMNENGSTPPFPGPVPAALVESRCSTRDSSSNA